MLRFSLGVTSLRNEFIRGTAHVRCFGDMSQARGLEEDQRGDLFHGCPCSQYLYIVVNGDIKLFGVK